MPATHMATDRYMLIEWMAQPPPLFSLCVLLWPLWLSMICTHGTSSHLHAFAVNDFSPVTAPFQVPTHLLTSSSNVSSSMKHLLRSRWCLIHLYVPSVWLRVKVMKCALKWESEWTEGQSQYPIADRNVGLMVWQTRIHILLLDLHLRDLGQVMSSLWDFFSLVVKWG